MGAGNQTLPRLFAELRRRRVFRVAAVYAALGWLAVEVTATTFPKLALPPWTETLVLVLVLLGFPFAVGLAWAYQVMPEGDVAAQAPRETRETQRREVREPVTGSAEDPASHVSAETSERSIEMSDRSIVVLPFDNLSPNPGDAYFSDGLTEEIITNISYLRGLRVISRNSAMVLKGTGKDTRTIGRELDVRYVLEGSVRKAGDALRITAQLIDARTDAHLWSKKYDGTMEDVFAIQESVARAIADAMQMELSPGEEGRLGKHPIPDTAAYQAYLRARQLAWQFTPGALDRARQEMLNGLEIVGPNPLFYAGLAYVHWALYDGGVRHEKEVLDEGEEYARRALELDPELPQAWAGRGLIRYKRGDMAGWIRDGRRAAELGLEGEVSSFLAFTLGEVGRVDEALECAEAGVAGDPLSLLPHFFSACAYLFAGRILPALDRIRDAHERMAPDDALIGWWHAQIAAYAAEDAEARRVGAEVLALDPNLFVHLTRLLVAGTAGDRTAVLRILDSTNLREVARTDEYYPVFLANNLALVGEHDQALEWIEQAIRWGFTNHVFLSEHNRFLEPLREHPRFVELMETARQKLEAFEA